MMSSLATAFGLIGFISGVVLYFFLLWIVLQRRDKRGLEFGLVALLASLLVWYGGNFISLLLRAMDIDKVASVLGIVEIISFSGLSVLPALLFHTHWLYYRKYFQPNPWEERLSRLLLIALYLILATGPLELRHLYPASSVPPFEKLGASTLPFLILLAVAYYACCLLQVRIVRQSRRSVEKALFKRLLVFFAIIPLFNFYAFWPGVGGPPDTQAFWIVLASLSSVVPTAIVAYYIYHYRFLQIVVHKGISTVLLLLFVLGVYLVVIRRFVAYLETELEAPSLLLQGVLLAAILLLFPPLSRWLASQAEALFSGEIRKQLRLAESINRTSPGDLDSQLLKEFIEEILQRELPADRVEIHLGENLDMPDDDTCFPLRAAENFIGYLKIEPVDVDGTSAEREALRLLANEIATVLDRNRLLESKRSLERELEEKSRLEELGRMAASVAHSVKNPLSSMKTLLQLLSEADNLTEEQRHEVGMMVAEINRLSKTITDLLKFSRRDQVGESGGSLKQVNLEYLLNSLQSVFRGELRARHVKLETALKISAAVIHSDADALTDALSNLLSNALEAAPAGSTIRVSIRGQGPEMAIEVEDEGPGIPLKLQSEVFKPFFTTKKRGTGLGLAIVKKRVAKLGGTVSVASPVNHRGTRFTVLLPIMEQGYADNPKG
jgi:signal transduction histidine kinase